MINENIKTDSNENKLGREQKKRMINSIIKSIKDSKNFVQAFTHTSFCNENNDINSYETLEFLGDSILNFYSSFFIYKSFPEYSEGRMSKLKQLMVQESTLAQLSKEINLSKYLILGTGEKKNKGIKKNSILADIFESFIAALYIEKGGKTVYGFLKITLFDWIKGKENIIWDYKSRLQEYCQSEKNEAIYTLKESNRENNKQIFIVEVSDSLKTFKELGIGGSKKEAEQNAASKVINKLKIGIDV